MDYRGWVLSIYDEYKKRYKAKYQNNMKVHINLKKIIKEALKKENIFPVVTIICYFFLIITDYILWGLKIINSIKFGAIFLIGTLIYLLCFSPYMYQNEPDIESYSNRIEILRKILLEQDIYNKEVITEIKDYTGSLFYKIRHLQIVGIINIMIATVFFVNFKGTIEKVNKQNLLYGIAVIISILTLIGVIYSILMLIPNNRIIRRKEFHELLKILITYDFQGKVSIINEENKVNSNEVIKEKDIIETVVKALTKQK